jgi:hypothetical protein
VSANGTDGLTVYKDGWSTGTVPVYLCGRVFDHALYNSLTEAAGTNGSAYFPAYRAGSPP